MAVTINIPSQVKTYANLAAFPASGSLKTIYIAEDTNKTYRWTGSVYVEISASAAMTWGAIGGTLSNQTDLQNALDAKVPTSRTLTINGVTQDLSANRTFTISTGITIGSTAIASGTVGRILFEGAGNVVQESSSLFWDSTNNRLGIGTSSPTRALEIVGNINDVYYASVKNANSGTNAFSGFIIENDVSSAAFQLTSTGNTIPSVTANQARFRTSSGISNGILFTTGTSAPVLFATNDTERLRIHGSTGNIGINTTTDAGFRLDVNGTARVQNVLTIQNLTADLYVRTTAWSGQSRIWFGDDSSDTIGGINYEHQFDRMNLRTNAGTRMTLFSTGNVGINTTTDAGFRLDVNGTARVSGVLTIGTELYLGNNNTGFFKSTNDFNFYNLANGSVKYRITGASQGFGISDNGYDTVAASAMLQVNSTIKGFLPPRMTTTQKNAIASPATGLQVYDTTLNQMSYYNGTTWTNI